MRMELVLSFGPPQTESPQALNLRAFCTAVWTIRADRAHYRKVGQENHGKVKPEQKKNGDWPGDRDGILYKNEDSPPQAVRN